MILSSNLSQGYGAKAVNTGKRSSPDKQRKKKTQFSLCHGKTSKELIQIQESGIHI